MVAGALVHRSFSGGASAASAPSQRDAALLQRMENGSGHSLRSLSLFVWFRYFDPPDSPTGVPLALCISLPFEGCNLSRCSQSPLNDFRRSS